MNSDCVSTRNSPLATTLLFIAFFGASLHAGSLKVHVVIGHASPKAAAYCLKLAAVGGVRITDAAADKLEAGDALGDGVWQGTAGGGDVDSLNFTLAFADQEIRPIQNLQVIWADLIAHSDADTVRRLTGDPAWRIDSRRLTLEMDPEGTSGFTLTVDQLLREKTFWIPALDVFVAAGARPLTFAGHRRALEQWRGTRVLDRVAHEPEASYGQYRRRWEDMGSPGYAHPSQPAPGHIVGLAWDSSVPKFGIDRGAGVWNDYGNPDRFRFWFAFSNLAEGIERYWTSQALKDGLPVITTVLERDGVRYEVEQFAYPLNGPPKQRDGNIKMVLLQRVKLTNLRAEARTVPVGMVHERKLGAPGTAWVADARGDRTLIRDGTSGSFVLAIGGPWPLAIAGVRNSKDMKRIDLSAVVSLAPRGTSEFTVLLPSPVLSTEESAALIALDYVSARAATISFWSEYVARGAQFEVPEKAVNELFRASLWHALRLPRRHGTAGPSGPPPVDLPYSNFAYDQTGTPWPVNQAVYVDYMLYGLRGYNAIASEELQTIYRNNQDASGRVSGFAHWLAYTPGMLYAVAQNYLLTGDRENFDRLLPATLRALDWCLDQIRKADAGRGHGLVEGPLNDATGDGFWAFNQAYLYAGIEAMGRALARIGHPRAAECFDTARAFREAIERAFRTASARSPLVQLSDHAWIPYVPCDATRPDRLYDQWYPTDVDTGAVHLLRLGAVPAQSDLGDWLLNDHEDNLFLHQWGIANEPVYNQQATAYLMRDDAPAVVRAFYSYMASAFSHSVFEPVEHRWRWGQYFGPPSTDGAWFELYRNMLVREADEHTLLLGQAAPRAWLEDGKKIHVANAPTYFGNVWFDVESHAAADSISATVKLNPRVAPGRIQVRLRHPQGKRIIAVTVNGERWTNFDAAKEWVAIPNPGASRCHIIAHY